MVSPTMDMDMATTTAMPTHMPTMDTTARGPLMLMLTMALMVMALPTTDMAMVSLITVMATMDTTAMPIPMPTTDTTARGLLMLLPLLMLTMALMAMVWLTTDTAMDMPITDTTDIPMPTTATPVDSTDIINLLIFVKN